MLIPSSGIKVYLVLIDIPMTQSLNGLSAFISGYLSKDPFSGDMFVFCNNSRNSIKIIYWERNGFCLWCKKLEKHKFPWPQKGTIYLEIGHRELMWLLDGLNIYQKGAYPSLDFSIVY